MDVSLQVEWTITEASNAKARGSVAYQNTVLGLNQMQGTFTQEQIDEFINKGKNLEEQNNDLQT